MVAGCGRSSDLQAQESTSDRFLLTLLPIPIYGESALRAFVPVYRCGAVLDSHQIPF
jgi:hypothetical protein